MHQDLNMKKLSAISVQLLQLTKNKIVWLVLRTICNGLSVLTVLLSLWAKRGYKITCLRPKISPSNRLPTESLHKKVKTISSPGEVIPTVFLELSGRFEIDLPEKHRRLSPSLAICYPIRKNDWQGSDLIQTGM